MFHWKISKRYIKEFIMMTQAFYTGVSGLKNYSTGIDVVANNLANISTVGFRGYQAEYASIFDDVLSTTASLQNDAVGVGVRLQTSGMNNSQGTLMQSDRATDLAIQGDGWFGIEKDSKPVFTRDGTFGIDENADLVTADGYFVLGTLAGNVSADNVLTDVVASTPLGDPASQVKLRLPESITYPPQPSTNVKFISNIGVGFEPVTMGATLIDPQNNKNSLKLEFTKDPASTPPETQYNLKATLSSLDGSTIYDTQTGRVSFDATGGLVSNTLTTINNNGSPVKIDLGSGLNGVVAMDTPTQASSSVADGTIGGELIGYSINENADIMATFSNGEQSSIGKVAIYHFQNDQALKRVSGTRFHETPNSGKAIFYKDAQGNNIIGTNVVNHRLEASNVAISSGLTELIVLQRSYDANSKSITTADQMIQKALSMDA